MKKSLVFIMTTLLLASCSTAPNKDRREWIEVTCSGFADWNNCYQKAKRYCPSGYDTANREESMITQKRSLLISCK